MLTGWKCGDWWRLRLLRPVAQVGLAQARGRASGVSRPGLPVGGFRSIGSGGRRNKGAFAGAAPVWSSHGWETSRLWSSRKQAVSAGVGGEVAPEEAGRAGRMSQNELLAPNQCSIGTSVFAGGQEWPLSCAPRLFMEGGHFHLPMSRIMDMSLSANFVPGQWLLDERPIDKGDRSVPPRAPSSGAPL